MSTKELITSMRNNMVEVYLDRQSSDLFDVNSETKYHIHHLSYAFLHNGSTYWIVAGFQYLDYRRGDNHYYAYQLEYRFQDDSTSCRCLVGPGPRIQGMEDHFHDVNSHDNDFKNFLRGLLSSSAFPAKAVNAILESDLSNGMASKYVQPLFTCNRISYLRENNTVLAGYVPVILEGFSDGDNAPCGLSPGYSRVKQSPKQIIEDSAGGLVSAYYSSVGSRVMRYSRWMEKNTTGRVQIWGNDSTWYIAFFENKEDAMKFKLMWNDDNGL